MKVIYVLIFILYCFGCSFLTQQNPFSNIDKLGTVIKPDEHIILKSSIGLVTIEYASPTKRWLIWNGESIELSLMKSSKLNGIYGDVTNWWKPLFGNIYSVSYSESAIVFSSDKEYQKYLSYYINELGFEHRTNTQMIVQCAIEGKCLYIGIEKYKFSEKEKNH